jgi:hypothetical protein
MTRRFPPPWSVEEIDACFIVRDADGPRPGRVSASFAGGALTRLQRKYLASL